MHYDERINIIKAISKTFALMQNDIRLHQSMNDFSINIHAEDFFCNVFNSLYPGKQFQNANSGTNSAYIDLIDPASRHIIQVTTTISKEKIDNSLKIFDSKTRNFNQYEFDIYYLLEKPKKLKKATIKEYKDKYGIEDINDHLKDYSDLINDIKNLPDKELDCLYRNYFRGISEKYTDEISLQVVFESLIKSKIAHIENYEEDFNSVELRDKIQINGLNGKVSGELYKGSEAALPIHELPDPEVLSQLRELVVNDLYKDIVKTKLRSAGVNHRDVANKPVIDLHLLMPKHNVSLDAILGELCRKIENLAFEADYQTTSMAWIIIAYFFEECDIGLKK